MSTDLPDMDSQDYTDARIAHDITEAWKNVVADWTADQWSYADVAVYKVVRPLLDSKDAEIAEAVRRVDNLQHEFAECRTVAALAAGYHVITDVIRQRDDARAELAVAKTEATSFSRLHEATAKELDSARADVERLSRELLRVRDDKAAVLCGQKHPNFKVWCDSYVDHPKFHHSSIYGISFRTGPSTPDSAAADQ